MRSSFASRQEQRRMAMRAMARRLAFFITPHGFGHATRALAVMAALLEKEDDLHFEIFSRIPDFLIHQSIGAGYRQHQLTCDVGLAQRSALEIDLPGTISRLQKFLPFEQAQIRDLAGQLRDLGCLGVVCDVSPMGVAVAKEAGLPSFLIENFTWDWIYGAYLAQCPALGDYIDRFVELYGQASYRIQTEPVGLPADNALTVPPVSRKSRLSRGEARARLAVPADLPLVALTMGGIAQELKFLDKLGQKTGYRFIIPGLSGSDHDHIRGLPGDFYHPDLMEAADAVIAKLGYSTVAEAHQAGAPLGYIERANFRESPALARFIRQTMPGLSITEQIFHEGAWLESLDDLLAMPRAPKPPINGADPIAGFILNHI